MKRSEFLKKSFALTAAGAFAGLFKNPVYGMPERSLFRSGDYNIIFILADDLGYGDLGVYGQKYIQTPNMDQLSEEGMRFNQCYAGSPVCAPSRCTLMTGLHTGHCTVRGNYIQKNNEIIRVPLPKTAVTVADLLKARGERTGIIGKWGLGDSGSTGVPNKQGFDYWFGYLNQHHAHNYYPRYLWENQKKVTIRGNIDGKHDVYSQDLFIEETLSFIKKNKNNPFFLYLPYTIPHKRYEIPDMAPYTNKDWTHDEKVYAAMVTKMDREVGRIRDLLKKLDIDKKTIIFVTSDNGAAERWQGLFDSCKDLRGIKRDMYEGGIRIPMTVTWPGVIPSGKVSEMPWYFPDVLPTLCDITGAPIPENIDGVSVWPTLQGENQSMKDRVFYWEFFEIKPKTFKQAVRWNDWKAVKNGVNDPIELYNLAEDPTEHNDIAESHKDIVRKMNGFMHTERTPSPYWHVT